MDRSRMYFCPNLATGLTTQTISAELAKTVFGDSGFAELLKTRYDQMVHWFRGAHYNDPHWDLEEPFSDCTNKADCDKKDARLVVPRSRLVSAPQNVTRLFDYDNFGHDMPVWVSYNQDPNAKRVMIVSQDPLRGSKNAKDEKGSLYLSTPFGIHSPDFENGGMDSRVHDMLNAFLDAGFCVYLTDNMKFYATRANKKEESIVKEEIRQNQNGYKSLFSKIIELEIGMFDPNLILILGLEVRDRRLTETSLVYATHPGDGFEVQNLNLVIHDRNNNPTERREDVISAYHPSGARGRATPIIRRLVQQKVGRNVEKPICKYYELIAEEVCNHLSALR